MQSLVMTLAKIGFMRRFFTWSQKRLMEKQNPELASVMRKLERLGPSPDPRQTQQVISRFTRAEKRAYDEYLAVARDQGALPEAPNRQARRQQQRMQGAAPKPTGGGDAQEGRQAPPLSRRGARGASASSPSRAPRSATRRSRRSPAFERSTTPAMRRKPCTIPS